MNCSMLEIHAPEVRVRFEKLAPIMPRPDVRCFGGISAQQRNQCGTITTKDRHVHESFCRRRVTCKDDSPHDVGNECPSCESRAKLLPCLPKSMHTRSTANTQWDRPTDQDELHCPPSDSPSPVAPLSDSPTPSGSNFQEHVSSPASPIYSQVGDNILATFTDLTQYCVHLRVNCQRGE